MNKFEIADRVQFTAEAIATCDPAIAGEELRGIVAGVETDGSLILVEFDDGDSEWYSPNLFEREVIKP